MSNNSGLETRLIKTDQFGELKVEPQHIFLFDEGLLGFEHLREFVLINEEETAPFRWLISLEEPAIGFPLLSPWHIDLSYKPSRELDLNKQVVMVIITLENDIGKMTANMKAPVIFDVEMQKGQQVILPSDKYSPNHEIPLNKN
jgi:flagellar assembly factor FliW